MTSKTFLLLLYLIIFSSAHAQNKDTILNSVDKTAKQKTISTKTVHNNETLNGIQLQIAQLEKRNEERNTNFFGSNWISIIVFILFAALLYLLMVKYSRLKERVDRYRKEIKEISEAKDWKRSAMQNSNSKDMQYKNTIDRYISDMNSAISKLQIQMTNLEIEIHERKELVPFVNTKPNSEAKPKIKIFYASIPNKDGSFNENSISEVFNPTESYYIFSMRDSQKANFEFLSDERAIKSAISSAELILYPVCKIKNSPTQNVKRIKTLIPGTVIKRSDKWELDNPAEIEYE